MARVIKNQDELVKRYREASRTFSRQDEAAEYLRLIRYENAWRLGIPQQYRIPKSQWALEFIEDINYSAKNQLRVWERKIMFADLVGSLRFIQIYTAYKWMLGHTDSDIFPGAFDSTEHPGELGVDAYRFIRRQIETGEWDRFTDAAIEQKEAMKRKEVA